MPLADNNGVKIHYEVEGQGAPLMLVHGFGGSLDTWQQLGYVQELTGEHRLILIDVRGCGDSDKPHDASAYTFQNLVADLVAVLDHLKIDKADYVGYSMGGRIGFRIPIYAPERFNSLTIGGAAYPIAGTEDAADDLLTGIHLTLEKAVKEAPQNPMEFFVATMEKRMGTTIPPPRKATFLADDAWALLASARAFRGAVSAKADEFLPGIELPVLLLVGEADPRFPTVRECAARIRGAKFVSFPGLDHVQAAARIDLILPVIRKFLGEAGIR